MYNHVDFFFSVFNLVMYSEEDLSKSSDDEFIDQALQELDTFSLSDIPEVSSQSMTFKIKTQLLLS